MDASRPAHVRGFDDVGIIPSTLNERSRAVNALTLLRYLADGIPVVTTPLPEVGRPREPTSDRSASVRAAEVLRTVNDVAASRRAA